MANQIGCALLVLIAAMCFPVFLSAVEGNPRQRQEEFLRRFFTDNLGKRIFVAKKGRGWREFLENNVIPVLPKDVTVVWRGESGRDQSIDDLFVALPLLGIRASAPFLVAVKGADLEVTEFNARLSSLKRFGKKNPEIQRQVRELFGAA